MKLITTVFICFLVCFCASTQELILSPDLKLKLSSPTLLAHSGDLLTLKYDNWRMTHEVLDPTRFVPAVDLTGVEHEFIERIFNPEVESTLPQWLQALAHESAKSLTPKGSLIESVKVGQSSVYSAYHLNEPYGVIFILENESIHKVEVFGEYAAFNHVKKRITYQE